MKTTSKRVISLLLAIMMVLSIFTIVPMTASAIELTDNALLESQDGDELTYSSNKFNEVGTSGGDSRLVFSESNITIADGTGNGADLTSKPYKDRVLALSKGTLIIKFKASNSSIYSLFSVSDSDQANKHYHIYVNNGVVGVEARNNDNSNNYNFKTSSAVITDKTGTNTIALKYENKTYTLFVNGKQYTFNQSGDRFISGIDGRDDIRLGATKRSGALQYKFTGEINFIKCYDVALSNEEIISFSKESLTELNCTANENEHTLTWNGTSNEGWTIKANGETVTPTSITCENDICTAVIPVTTVNDVTYTVENDTHYGSVTVESVAIPEISAKALYKTHKLEWTDSITDANFTVTSSAGEIASNNLSITYVDVDDVRNYTALVTVGTGVKAGTSYIVKKDGNNFGMGTVSETTSFDALKKNALLVVDYTKEDLGYKSFDGATNGVKVDGITDVQAAKLAKLTNGAIITSANYRNINGNQAIISLSGTSQACWFGTRNNNKQVGGEINNWLKGSLSGVTLTAGIHNSVIAYNSSNWFMGCDTTAPYTGNNDSRATFTCWTPNTANTGITKDSIYVGSTSSGTNKFNGDVYYVIVSEESYVSADLSVFTGIHANKYNAFKSQITALESNIPQVTNDTFSVIDNDKYQTLKNTLETLKSYTITNNSDKELDSALDTINSQFASLDYKGNVVPVSNYILNANASVNTYANNGSTDGGVSFLFDGNTKINNKLTLWHTFYGGSGGQGNPGITANNPAALQLGFGDVIKLKQVVCTPRKENSNEIANYTLYVSTADTMPALTADISTKAELDSIINDSEKGWKEVKTGTLAKVIAGNQIITLDKAEDAKWMLLVMTSASEKNSNGLQYIALSSMSIYRENSNIIKLDNNVVKEHAKVNSRPAKSDGTLAWGHDGGVECLFDTNEDGSFNLTTMLHSNYGYHATQNNAGAGATTVNAETPYCLQLGFDNAINLKKLCYYVRANEWDGGIPNQLKSYEIYVSNSETEPELTTDMQQKSDLIGDGWTLVKKGTVGCTTVPNDKKEIVFDAPVNAKWVRLVVTEAQGKTGATNDGLSITALEVYAEENAVLNTSTNFANDSVKWNNTTERVNTLATNATANVQETGRGVKFIFNGNYELNVHEGEFYGSWQEKEADRKDPWIQTSFGGESVCVSGIVIFDRLQNKNGSKIAQNCFNYYEVLLSNDANFENYIVAASGQRTDKSYSDQGYAIKFDQPYDCKYIKFVTHGDVDCKIVEMDIYEYVGMKSETATTVAIDTTACTVANDKLLKTVDFNFNKMFANGFTKAELEKQVLDIELSDISHNYKIVVDDNAQVSIVATDATYNLTVSANGTTTDNAQTKKYGENFDYTVENAKGWQVDGKVIANGNTFNFMATDDVTVTAITDTVSTEVSVYIPEPVVGFDGTKTTVQIPVYVNGTTAPAQKGIVFVKTGTAEDTIKAAITAGTSTSDVKISKADSATLSNKGRYIHTIKANGKLTTGTFYAYVIDGDNNVTLSNAQVIG